MFYPTSSGNSLCYQKLEQDCELNQKLLLFREPASEADELFSDGAHSHSLECRENPPLVDNLGRGSAINHRCFFFEHLRTSTLTLPQVHNGFNDVLMRHCFGSAVIQNH